MISWENIYEAIEENYVKEGKIFTIEFLQICQDNLNELQNIPEYLKKHIKINSLENGLFF